MIYIAREMEIKSDGELITVEKGTKKIAYPGSLRIGGIYFLDGKTPWKIEDIEEEIKK